MLEPIPRSTEFMRIAPMIFAKHVLAVGMSMMIPSMQHVQCVVHLLMLCRWMIRRWTIRLALVDLVALVVLAILTIFVDADSGLAFFRSSHSSRFDVLDVFIGFNLVSCPSEKHPSLYGATSAGGSVLI